jgi:hypothetical protein
VASLASGQLDILLQRRLLFDDNRGVGEPLNETREGIEHEGECARRGGGVTVSGKHVLLLGEGGREGMRELRGKMEEEFLPGTFWRRGGGGEGGRDCIILIFLSLSHTATLFFSTHADLLASPALLSPSSLPSSSSPSSSSPSPSSSASSSSPLSSFFGGDLPPSLSLMTFQKISCRGKGEKWTTLPIKVEEEDEEGREEGVAGAKAPRFIVRLAHQFAVGEDSQELSQPVTVDLAR